MRKNEKKLRCSPTNVWSTISRARPSLAARRTSTSRSTLAVDLAGAALSESTSVEVTVGVTADARGEQAFAALCSEVRRARALPVHRVGVSKALEVELFLRRLAHDQPVMHAVRLRVVAWKIVLRHTIDGGLPV